jgi:DNA-binding LytR/AlgR family response regulator
MEKIKILIVEDELIVSEEIKEILIESGYDVVGQADNGSKSLGLAEQHLPDLVVMDINIKGEMDGITVAGILRQKLNPAIIFLTAYYDKAFIDRAKKIQAAAYLVKPYDKKNLLAAIEMAIGNQGKSLGETNDSYRVNDGIFIKEQSNFVKIHLDAILYVEAVGSYIDIHTTTGRQTLAINLKTFEERVGDPRFFRVHRSFLVNLNAIEVLSGNTIQIKDRSIPISGPHRDEFMKRYKFI